VVAVRNVDGAAVTRRAVVAEFDDLLDPSDAGVFGRRFEGAAAQREAVLGVELRLDFEAVSVERERLDDNVLEQLGAVQRVLLSVLVE